MAEVASVITLVLIGMYMFPRHSTRNLLVSFVKYKVKKRYVYKQIEKSLEQKNYKNFKEALMMLKEIDYEFNTTKYFKMLEKLRLTNDIIEDEQLFKFFVSPKKILDLYKNNKSDDVLDIEIEKINNRLKNIERSISRVE